MGTHVDVLTILFVSLWIPLNALSMSLLSNMTPIIVPQKKKIIDPVIYYLKCLLVEIFLCQHIHTLVWHFC